MFPTFSWAKIKGGIFTGPQIRVMIDSVKSEDIMTKPERKAWYAIRMVAQCFLGNNQSENYKEFDGKISCAWLPIVNENALLGLSY